MSAMNSPFHQSMSILHGAIERSEGIALVDLSASGHRQLSFLWLSKHVDLLETALVTNEAAKHVTDGAPNCSTAVALIAPRCAESVAALLAIWRVGGIYLPLDIESPCSLLCHAIDDVKPSAIFTNEPKAQSIRRYASQQRLALPPILSAENGRRIANGDVSLEPTLFSDDVSHLIYTSGSTGCPKAVLCTRAGLRVRCEWGWQSYAFEGGVEVCAVRCDPSFVDSLWELLGPLAAGATLLLLPANAMHNPARLVQLLHIWRVTRLLLVPHALSMLTDAWEHSQEVSVRFSSPPPLTQHLRVLSVSGDALPLTLALRAARCLPAGCRLLNLYGSSEVSGDCLCYRVPESKGASERSERPQPPHPPTHESRQAPSRMCNLVCPVGWPIAGAGLRLEAEGGGTREMLSEDEGELIVGGPLVALGYLNRPRLTSEHFFESDEQSLYEPIAATAEQRIRWFRTGDWVRQSTDGCYHFLGRIDRGQLQVRGVRVEVAEVEAAYCDPASPVVDAVAIGLSHGIGGVHDTHDGPSLASSSIDQLVLCCEARSHKKCADGGTALDAVAEPVVVVSLANESAAAVDGSLEAADEVSLLPSLSAELAPQLIGWAEERLPLAARPTAFIVLRQLPRLSSDKPDRRRLHRLAPAMLRAVAVENQARRLNTRSDHAVGSKGGDAPSSRAPLSTDGLADESKLSNDAYDIDACDDGDGTTMALELCTRLGMLLGRPVWPDEELAAVGCTSVIAVALVHCLERELGWSLPPEALLRPFAATRSPSEARTTITIRDVSSRITVRRLATEHSVDEAEATGPLERMEAEREQTFADQAMTRRLWSQHALPSQPSEAKRPRDGGGLPEDAVAAWQRGRAEAATLVPASSSSSCVGPAEDGSPSAVEVTKFEMAWRVDLGKCVDAPPLLVCTCSAHSSGQNVKVARKGPEAVAEAQDANVDINETIVCIVGSHAGVLSAVELLTGQVLWRVELPCRIEAPCIVIGSVVLVGGHDEHLHALTLSTGRRLWSRRCGGAVKAGVVAFPAPLCPPSLCEAAALCACFGGDLTALDAATGRLLWRPNPTHEGLDGPVFATPLVDQQRMSVVVADLRGSIHCWSSTSTAATMATSPLPSKSANSDGMQSLAGGSSESICMMKRWRVCTTARPDGGGASPVFSSPALASCRGSACVVFGSTDGLFYCLSMADGARLWTYDACGGPIFSSPCCVPPAMGHAATASSSLGARVLMTASASGRLDCLSLDDGALIWSQGGRKLTGHSAPAESEGVVIAADVEGGMHSFCLTDGRPMASHALPGAIFSSPVLHPRPRTVVVGCRDNGLWSLKL